jgi:hypothetical protein
LSKYFNVFFVAVGVTRGRNIKKIGMNSSDTAELFFEDVRVPQSYAIGDEGMGFMYQMLQFQEERLCGTAAGRPSGYTFRPVLCIVKKVTGLSDFCLVDKQMEAMNIIQSY